MKETMSEQLLNSFEKMKKIDPKCPDSFGRYISYLLENAPKKTLKEKLIDFKNAFAPRGF